MELIRAYFPNLTEQQTDQLTQLEHLYKEWNGKINVISRKDIDHLYIHHVLHSLAIAKFISFKPKTKIIDIGTGGGFPGVPLAILFPECHFYLIDSIGKKIKVVNEVVSFLKLKNVIAKQARAEEVKDKFHFAVTRAVARLNILIKWSQRLMEKSSFNDLPNGLICLKGGNISEEIQESPFVPVIEPISRYFKSDYFNEKHLIYLPLK